MEYCSVAFAVVWGDAEKNKWNEALELNAGGFFWLKNMKYIHSLVKKHEVHPFDEMFHPWKNFDEMFRKNEQVFDKDFTVPDVELLPEDSWMKQNQGGM